MRYKKKLKTNTRRKGLSEKAIQVYQAKKVIERSKELKIGKNSTKTLRYAT